MRSSKYQYTCSIVMPFSYTQASVVVTKTSRANTAFIVQFELEALQNLLMRATREMMILYVLFVGRDDRIVSLLVPLALEAKGR